MKAINHRAFEDDKALMGAGSRVAARVKAGLALLGSSFRPGHDTARLPARLRRDAGIDETDVERRRVANAPLIR